ncbi:DUF6084 family protein [Rugosimonospora acidiphila]|uniref:DUF6084 family protein n=1 Tax=Rugosimonospora acidiphila TaxID=556531 RepID=A0ABP9SFR8_9ACTN
MTTSSRAIADVDAAPALRIAIASAAPVDLAAVPTLRFEAHIHAEGGHPVRSVALHTQLRIAAAQRPYAPADQQRLVEIFGTPDQWGRTVGSLLWTQTTTQVPEFDGDTVADILVGCTYDFDVVASKYLHALQDGEVPLEFLFSGTVFYSTDDGLRAARIPWDTEASYRMPVRVWRDLMGRYFPDSTWLRLDRTVFDRLYGFRARNALPSWESAIDALLRAAERPMGGV